MIGGNPFRKPRQIAVLSRVRRSNRPPHLTDSLTRMVAALEATDPHDRRLAAETLGALGRLAAPVLHTMIERSTDPNPSVRYAVLWALEQVPWRDVDATPIFVRLLEH